MARWQMYSGFKLLYSEEIAEKENGRLVAGLSSRDGQTTTTTTAYDEGARGSCLKRESKISYS